MYIPTIKLYKTLNIILFLIFQAQCLLPIINNDDNDCNQYIQQILIDQGFMVKCEPDRVIVADCNYQDFQNIEINIQNQNCYGGIIFTNVKNLHFKNIILEDLNTLENNYIINIGQGEIIDIQNIQINSKNEMVQFERIYQIRIFSVQQLNISNLIIQSQNINENISYELLFFGIKKSINIKKSILNIKKYSNIILVINSKESVFIEYLNYSVFLESLEQKISTKMSSENIHIDQLDINIQTQQTSIIINEVILQHYLLDRFNFSEINFGIYTDNQIVIFDLRCLAQQQFIPQKIHIKKIEVFRYQAYQSTFLYCKSCDVIVIDQIIFHENKERNEINFWNSQGMFVFDGSFFNNSQVIINNVDLNQMNYISSQHGIIYLNSFQKINISNITLSSLQNFQSQKGNLISIQNSKNIKIYNVSATIQPTCLFKSQFGGLIFLDKSDKVNITNIQFNSPKMFRDEVQHTGSQGGIIYIYSGSKFPLYMQNIIAYGPFSSSADGAFAYINIAENLILKDTIITQFTSQKNGGALFVNSEMLLSNVKLIGNKSFFSGGAIHGSSSIQAENVLIEKNESLFGGGIYLIDDFYDIQNIQFKDNIGLIRGNDFCHYIEEIQLIQLSEFNIHLNPPHQIKNYSLNQTKDNLYLTDFVFSGFTYFITMKFRMLGESDWIENIDNRYIIQNRYNDLTSLLNFEEENNLPNLSIKQNISLSNSNSNKPQTRCLSCSKDQFELCQADFSSLRKGYWRQNITVDSSLIYPCSINQFNCIGGNFIGNQLCAEGHIGVECQECDLYNVRGQGQFTRKNIYQCSKCEKISYNIIKIIFLVLAIFIAIIIIFKNNYRQQKNFIYKKYLSDMKMLYLGKSYYRLGQSGSYIKILTFYFQIINISSQFYGTQSWINAINFQQSFYNPINDSSFSLDCFLSKFSSSSNTIIYQKIVIVTIAPFIIVVLSLIPSIFQLFKSKYKSFQNSASLIISYGFTNLFCIPVLDILTQGILCRTFNNGESYAILDFSLQCNDPDRLLFVYAFVIPFLLIYSILIPGALFYFLYNNRINLDKISCRFLLGFLYVDFKRKFYYWEYIRLTIKFVLIITLYGFLSSPLLVGFVTLAILILYLIKLVKNQPFVTKKLNEMEVKSIVIGSLYLIAYMISFSLYQQEISNKNSFSSYNVFSSILLFTSNLVSVLFIIYMLSQISISLLQPKMYKLENNKCFIFIAKYFKILRLIKYTERKRKNFIKLRNIINQIIQNNYKDIIILNQNDNKSQSTDSSYLHNFIQLSEYQLTDQESNHQINQQLIEVNYVKNIKQESY
ncbi:hypothetical protein ABPG74_007795 [Tetrahymena malaccensis]